MPESKKIASVPLILHEIEMYRAKMVRIILLICLILALLLGVSSNFAWFMHYNRHEAPDAYESSAIVYNETQ